MVRSVNVEIKAGDPALNIALDTINKGKQALVFVNTKRSAEKVAEDISKKLAESSIELETLAHESESALSNPTKQCLRLSKCIRKGIAFHHAGLHTNQRELIEDNFRTGQIKIICCTPTLAAGLDMPAFRAIIRDLKRHGGNWGMVNIPVLEYHQMAGRAGRPGKDPYGEAICIAKSQSEQNDISEHYLRGNPESIYSKLAVEPVLRTYVLSLIATGYVNDEDSLIQFFSKTFWAMQYQDMGRLRGIILKVLDLLEDYGFIYKVKKELKQNIEPQTEELDSLDDDFMSADTMLGTQIEVSKEKIRATRIGKRVAELYVDPYTANHLINSMKEASLRENPKSEGFLVMISNTIEMRPLVRVRKKTEERVQDFLIEKVDELFEDEPSLYDPEYQDFYDAVHTSLFFDDWVNEVDEEMLLETFGVRPGETRYKVDKAEWLIYASIEFASILELKDIKRHLLRLAIRIKYGVNEDLLPLLKFKNIGRVRARKLFNNGIKTIKEVKESSLTTLSQIVGSKIAASLKEQVGEKVEEVNPRKRVGQMSIQKFDK